MFTKHKSSRRWLMLLGLTLLTTLAFAPFADAQSTENPVTICGTVMDENDQPVAGIRIRPRLDDFPDPVYTDQNGKFSVPVNNEAVMHGFIAISNDNTLIGDYYDLFSFRAKTWPPDSEIVIPVRKVGLRTISGTVVDADGNPAEGVQVGIAWQYPADIYSTKTDASGAFQISYPDRYSDQPRRETVFAFDPKLGVAVKGNYELPLPIASFQSPTPVPEPETPEISDDLDDSVFMLKLAPFIEDRIRVLDAEGQPIPGCTIVGNGLSQQFSPLVTTDAQGFATVKVTPPSRYASPFTSLLIEGPKDGVTDPTTGKIVYYLKQSDRFDYFRPVDDVRTVRLSREARIHVTLKNQDGTPASYTVVMYKKPDYGSYNSQMSGLDGTTTILTDAGAALIIAAYSKFGVTSTVARFDAGDGTEDKTLGFTFQKGTKVTGTMKYFDDSSEPVPARYNSFNIVLKVPESDEFQAAYQVQSDDEGNFECVLVPGTYYFPGGPLNGSGKRSPVKVVIPEGVDAFQVETPVHAVRHPIPGPGMHVSFTFDMFDTMKF